MLLKRRQISSSVSDSNPTVLTCDVRYIYECARVCKQKIVCISSVDNTMYATNDEFCGLHEIKLPFECNSDLIIILGTAASTGTVLETYDSFFIPELFPWVLMPVYYWDMYKSGDIVHQYSQEENLFILYDKTIMKPIDVIYLYRPTQEALTRSSIVSINEFLVRRSRAINPIMIKDLHLNPEIQNGFFVQKSTFGGFNVVIDYYGKRIPFTFYKGMVALNRSDTMDAIIYEDSYMKGIYIMELIPMKKKNPIKGSPYNIPFSERVFFCYKGTI